MKEPIDYLSTLFVGIDIASRIHVISALDFNEEFYIKMKPVENTQEGSALMEQMISDVLGHNHPFKYVVIGMEATGFYGVHLANYLSASDLLAPFSVRVYCLNPKEVKNYKKSWRGSQYLALQRLTRHHMHITECIAREKTYMLNNIYLKFSEYALLRDGQHPFTNKYGATAEAILTEYTTNEDIVNSSAEDLVAFINSKSKGRIADPEETAKILQAAARNSYWLDKCLYEPLTISIASSFNCISSFERELKAIDKAILQTIQGLNPDEYTVLNSIPGIGKVYSAGILAEMDSIKAFPNANALAKYCGIVWNDNDSGDFVAEDKHMSKAGNRCDKTLS